MTLYGTIWSSWTKVRTVVGKIHKNPKSMCTLFNPDKSESTLTNYPLRVFVPADGRCERINLRLRSLSIYQDLFEYVTLILATFKTNCVLGAEREASNKSGWTEGAYKS